MNGERYSLYKLKFIKWMNVAVTFFELNVLNFVIHPFFCVIYIINLQLLPYARTFFTLPNKECIIQFLKIVQIKMNIKLNGANNHKRCECCVSASCDPFDIFFLFHELRRDEHGKKTRNKFIDLFKKLFMSFN